MHILYIMQYVQWNLSVPLAGSNNHHEEKRKVKELTPHIGLSPNVPPPPP